MQLKHSDYVLGHTDREQRRLIRQARVLAPATEHFLRDAGIVSGMRVLDIGCGMGDVTMLVAQLVGPQGKVVSIDLDQASLSTAQERATRQGSTIQRSAKRTSRPSRTSSPSMQSSDGWCWNSSQIRLRR
jgi:tRNA A58 N-methylase Trm61